MSRNRAARLVDTIGRGCRNQVQLKPEKTNITFVTRMDWEKKSALTNFLVSQSALYNDGLNSLTTTLFRAYLFKTSSKQKILDFYKIGENFILEFVFL